MSSEEKPAPREESNLHIGLSLLLAAVIGVFFLYLAARSVSLGAVGDYLAEVDLLRLAWGAVVFIVLYALCHGARVVRWLFLVRPLGEVEPSKVYKVGAVGFTAILLLPLRLGELVRPFLMARTSKVSGAGALATVVVERVIDGLVVTGLLFAGLWTYSGEASLELARGAGMAAAAIFVPALVMCFVAYYNRRLARRLVMATLGRLSEKWGQRVAKLLEQFATGFAAMSKGGDLIPFLGLTAVYWTANVVSMWALLRIGFDLDIGLWEMVTVLAVLVVGIMVPAGPAMAGNFEFFMLHGIGLYVPVEVEEVGAQAGFYAALVHLLQILVIVLPGVWIMIRDRSLRWNRKTLEASKRMEAEEGSELTGPRPEK